MASQGHQNIQDLLNEPNVSQKVDQILGTLDKSLDVKVPKTNNQ